MQPTEETAVVVRERTLDAPPEDVWETLTDEVLLERWLTDEVELDLREGGDARFEVDGETRHARIERVAPAEALTFSWWSGDGEPPQRVEFRLEPAGGRRTRLVVVETRSAAGAPAWAPSLRALAAMHAAVPACA